VTQLGLSAAVHSARMPGRDASVELSWAGLTDTGLRRGHNEDSLLTRPPVFAVADGMGGHAAGDVASAAVVTRLAEGLAGDFLEPGTIDSALREATADIALAADDEDLGVGTTVTGIALTAQGDGAYWTVFNVGDSRVYLFEDGELSRLTIDHSVVQELVDSGAIKPEDAESHPRSNIITRAVGFNLEPVPDYWMLPVRSDVRLLLCSDGLTKELKETEIRRRLAAGQDAEHTARGLLTAALQAGGRDNVTVVVVDVTGVTGFFGTRD
jgi:PPM family protein phosphatase